MGNKPKNIQFKNQKNANVQFDIIKLEDLYTRKDINHSIETNHKVEFYILMLVEDGLGSHTIDFNDYECSTGTLLTIRKDQIHKFSAKNSLKDKLLIFTNEFLVNYLEKTETQKTMLLFN